jgi:hypothetical protein
MRAILGAVLCLASVPARADVVVRPGVPFTATQLEAAIEVRGGAKGLDIEVRKLFPDRLVVLDHSTGTRATVMRGEIELHCPSGTRMIRSGTSGSCGPAADAGAPAVVPPPAHAPEKPADPDLPRMKPVTPQPRAKPVAGSVERPAPSAADLQRPEPIVGRRPTRDDIIESLRPLPALASDGYAAVEAALRRGDLEAAHAALLAIVDASPGSLDAATALLDLARLEKTRGAPARALGYLDRLDRHPHRAALATAAARLRAALVSSAIIQRLTP